MIEATKLYDIANRETKNDCLGLIDECVSELTHEFLKCDWTKPEFYCFWMAQHWQLVRLTERFIHLAGGATPVEETKQYEYWTHHLKEEFNHHKLLENDAKFFGVDLERIHVLPETTALRAAIRQAIPDTNGVYLFGYATLLEGLSCEVGPWMLNVVRKAYGPKASSFLSVHIDSDAGEDGHYQKVRKLIRAMPATDQAIVAASVTTANNLYFSMLKRAAQAFVAPRGSA